MTVSTNPTCYLPLQPLDPGAPCWTSEPASAVPRATLEARFAELSEFVRCIAEGESPIGDGKVVHGQRAIELAAWELYRKLQESHQL